MSILISQLKKIHLSPYFARHKQSGILILLILLTLLPILLTFAKQRTDTKSNATSGGSYDVIVVGGSTGGVSAAIQAARTGVRVALVEETDWLGGQMTAAGVSMMDEGTTFSTNPPVAIERNSGLYNEFMTKVKQRYGGEQYMHKCLYYPTSLCFEPKIGNEVLKQMVDSTGNIDRLMLTKVNQVIRNGTKVTGVLTSDGRELDGKVVIDATEYGDLLPLGRIAYRAGNSTSEALNKTACIQDITYTAILKKYDGGVPAALKLTEPPGGAASYNAAKAQFASYVSNSIAGTGWPYGKPRKWITNVAYRGIPEIGRPNPVAVNSYEDATTITKTGLNLPNDYPVTVAFLEDSQERVKITCEAKMRTLQFIYYMQNELGESWSVADDEGFQDSAYTANNLCSNIQQSQSSVLKNMEKYLPLIPYARESRRVIGKATMVGNQMKEQKAAANSGNNTSALRNATVPSTIAVGGYDDDLHGCNTADTLESSLESVTDKNAGHGAFQVPLEALIPETIDGFLVAEKNISQSRLVNGATRLQPITMLTGQAVGALAGLSVKQSKEPRYIRPIDVQQILVNAQTPSPLTLAPFIDAAAPTNTSFWPSIQLAAVNNILSGNSGYFGTNDTILRSTAAVVLTRLFGMPTTGTEDDAITQLRARGLSNVSSNADFGPTNPLLKGQLALFIARFMNQQPANADEAISFVTSRGISVGCPGGTCQVDPVTRGQFAETSSTYLLATQKAPVVPPAPERSFAGGVSTNQNNPQQRPNLIGWQDYVTETGSLVGWACDKANNDKPLRVDIYIDGDGFGQFIGTATADRPGDDSATIAGLCGNGNGNRRYIYQLPDWLRNNGSHQIYTWAVSAGDVDHILVPNSGQPFALGNKNPYGYQDYVDTSGRAWGWVCDPDDFNQAIRVDFYMDGPAGQGQLLGSTTANVPDEKAVGYFCGGVNAHRYAWQLPESALSGNHTIYAYGINIGGSGETKLLNNSPVSSADRKSPPQQRAFSLSAVSLDQSAPAVPENTPIPTVKPSQATTPDVNSRMQFTVPKK